MAGKIKAMWTNKDIRNRILFTLFAFLVYRLGSAITVPDVNTTDLVNYTDKFVNYSNKRYGQVWVMFDKDDYSDDQFDKAIRTCDYNVAWSNPNFELWILSHLKRVSRVISKDEILDELNKEFQKNGLGTYKKNDDKIFIRCKGKFS